VQQDTYIVALHYVLFGGAIFGLFGGIYYWFTSSGSLMGGWASSISVMPSASTSFSSCTSPGLLGMPRRIYTYSGDQGWIPGT
jgi:heme/copper-type cytochrome/quinol oxidase subunit 1